MRKINTVLGVLAGALLARAALAAEIQVLSAGALQPGLIAAVEVFRKESGHEVKVTYFVAAGIE